MKTLSPFDEFIAEGLQDPHISPQDKIIMSHESQITPRMTTPYRSSGEGIDFKPRGLWYAFGTEWIDWVRSNMPEWERSHLHRVEIDYSHVLRLGRDMSMEDFERKYGHSRWMKGVITDIDWAKLAASGWHGIEIENPWGEMGSWIRTWDISSGCIWNPKAIITISKIN